MGNVVHHPKGEERDPALISNKPAREIFEALSEGVAKVDSKRGALRSSGSMDNLKGSKKKIPKRKDKGMKSGFLLPECADVFEAFKSIPQFEKKITLDLTGGLVSCEEDLAIVAQIIIDSRYLHRIVARHCGLTNEVLKRSKLCSALSSSKSLRKVDVSFNPLGFAGAEQVLEAVATNSRITEVYLGGVQGGNELAAYTAEFLQTRPLDVMDISENLITEEGWECVYATAKKYLHVTDVRLKENEGVTNMHTKSLGHLMKRNEAVGMVLNTVIDNVFTRVAVSRRTTQTADVRKATASGPPGLRPPFVQDSPAVGRRGGGIEEDGTVRTRSRGRTIDISVVPSVPVKHEDLEQVAQSESTCLNIGASETIGKRREMQDAMLIRGKWRGKDDEDLIAVFDGHGSRDGAIHAAKRFSEMFEQILSDDGLEDDPLEGLRRCFIKINDELRPNATHYGTTAAVAYLRGDVLYSANVGDSRVVLARKGGAVRLTVDHNTDNPEECTRVERMEGGYLRDGRVQGSLKITRALGDAFAEPYVSAEPYLRRCRLRKDEDDFVIVACDGLFDIFMDDVAVEIARSFIRDPALAAERLRDQAYLSGSTDNITVVVAGLKKSKMQWREMDLANGYEEDEVRDHIRPNLDATEQDGVDKSNEGNCRANDGENEDQGERGKEREGNGKGKAGEATQPKKDYCEDKKEVEEMGEVKSNKDDDPVVERDSHDDKEASKGSEDSKSQKKEELENDNNRTQYQRGKNERENTKDPSNANLRDDQKNSEGSRGETESFSETKAAQSESRKEEEKQTETEEDNEGNRSGTERKLTKELESKSTKKEGKRKRAETEERERKANDEEKKDKEDKKKEVEEQMKDNDAKTDERRKRSEIGEKRREEKKGDKAELNRCETREEWKEQKDDKTEGKKKPKEDDDKKEKKRSEKRNRSETGERKKEEKDDKKEGKKNQSEAGGKGEEEKDDKKEGKKNQSEAGGKGEEEKDDKKEERRKRSETGEKKKDNKDDKRVERRKRSETGDKKKGDRDDKKEERRKRSETGDKKKEDRDDKKEERRKRSETGEKKKEDRDDKNEERRKRSETGDTKKEDRDDKNEERRKRSETGEKKKEDRDDKKEEKRKRSETGDKKKEDRDDKKEERRKRSETGEKKKEDRDDKNEERRKRSETGDKRDRRRHTGTEEESGISENEDRRKQPNSQDETKQEASIEE